MWSQWGLSAHIWGINWWNFEWHTKIELPLYISVCKYMMSWKTTTDGGKLLTTIELQKGMWLWKLTKMKVDWFNYTGYYMASNDIHDAWRKHACTRKVCCDVVPFEVYKATQVGYYHNHTANQTGDWQYGKSDEFRHSHTRNVKAYPELFNEQLL